MKLGTIEPKYTDLHPLVGCIEDDQLAFIYGAIAKYGTHKELVPELKEYILNLLKK